MASVHPARAPPSDAAIGTAAVRSDGDGTGGIAADVAARASSGNGGTPDAPAARKTMTKHPSVEQFAIDADEEGAGTVPIQVSKASGQDEAARISLQAADTQGGGLAAPPRLWSLFYLCHASLGVTVTLALCLKWCGAPAHTVGANDNGQLWGRRGAVQGLAATQAALAAQPHCRSHKGRR